MNINVYINKAFGTCIYEYDGTRYTYKYMHHDMTGIYHIAYNPNFNGGGKLEEDDDLPTHADVCTPTKQPQP